MLIRSFVFFGSVLFLLCLQATSVSPDFWIWVAPLMAVISFYLSAGEQTKRGGILMFLSFILIVVSAFITRDAIYVFFAAALLLLFGGFLYYRRVWNERLLNIEERKKSTAQETAVLRERYEVRQESLRHLEHQVSGLTKLFEIARDFNECLSFASLISVMEQKVSGELPFLRGTLILLDLTQTNSYQMVQAISFGTHRREQEETHLAFSKYCVEWMKSEPAPMRIENAEALPSAFPENLSASFPVWIFPLLIERRLIAVLAVEGPSADDYAKFEILASQLGLQVKKIRLYETVKEISILDGLTQVFVRRHFLDRFREELRRAVRYQFPISVLMVDVDHFKSYNDRYGHLVGDRTLREIAQVIREHVRKVDVLGRYGGEEFLIVAPEISREKGLELAERIRSAVARKKLRIYDEDIQVTVSIGLSSFPEDLADPKTTEHLETSISELIHKADQAMYHAKEEGRNRVMIYR